MFSYDLCLLYHTIDNIIDLFITFEADLGGLLNSYAVDLDKIYLKNLTTFRQSIGLQLASLLVKPNPGFKTVTIPSRTSLFNFFLNLPTLNVSALSVTTLRRGTR
jgi:hypothetical protein